MMREGGCPGSTADAAAPEPSADRLMEHVRRLEGPRHPDTAPARHAAARYVGRELDELGCEVGVHRFRHRGRTHRNVAGRTPAAGSPGGRILVGAHYDTVAGTPGADDNASGVAVLLETARLLLADGNSPGAEFVAFDLEEPRGGGYRHGSQAWVDRARARGEAPRAALVLEMVGYTDDRPGSQRIPWPLRWRDLPETGTFLAAVGDWKSGGLLRRLESARRVRVPGLELVTTRVPLRGWLVPQSRLSDNASFWDAGIPALMLTDTAFLRNPHYHGPGDRAETLDPGFMSRVTALVAAGVRALAT